MTSAYRRSRSELPSFVLRLYVTGRDPSSVRAIANIEEVLREYLPNGSTLDIVDILRHPQRGVRDQILVVPTLVKLIPAPVRRIFGDLSDREQLLAGLGLTSSDRRTGQRGEEESK